jgi:subtilisin family serine protease
MSARGFVRFAIVLSLAFLAAGGPAAQDTPVPAPRLDPLEVTDQFPTSTGSQLLADASALVRVNDARARMNVSGKGLAAVVIDSGVYRDHTAFCGRARPPEDFTGDRRPNPALDRDGHGTHVAGIIAASGDVCQGTASGIHHGMAPAAVIYSLKAADEVRGSDWTWIGAALKRALDLVRQRGAGDPLIGVVNLSIGSPENLQSDNLPDRAGIVVAIRDLAALGVPVVTASGNAFFRESSIQGMSFPAIVRDTISVGAVFNRKLANTAFGLAFARVAKPGQIAPFSQRLHADTAAALETDIFAPGAEIRSVGILNRIGASAQKGTSQAAPMVSGAILLLQEYYNVRRGNSGANLARPPIEDLSRWLKDGSKPIQDNYGEDDNVENTGKSYRMLDVLGAVEKLKAEADTNTLR